MLLAKEKVSELYVRLEEFGVDVEALKRVGISADALEVLYCAVRIVDAHRAKKRQRRRFGSLLRNPLA
jgi:hypothetical protein